LRERGEDIPILIDCFIDQFSRRKSDNPTALDPLAMQSLKIYPWPGNVRELENLVQRLVILHRGKLVTLKELPEKYRCQELLRAAPLVAEEPARVTAGEPPAVAPPPDAAWGVNGLDFNGLISEFEDRLILQAMTHAGGNKKEAARLLNLKRTTLIEKIKKKNLPL
jgi:DNA-binding NtrC family response regulator